MKIRLAKVEFSRRHHPLIKEIIANLEYHEILYNDQKLDNCLLGALIERQKHMSKLLRGILSAPVERNPDVDNWNAAVQREFGPFIRRKSILHKYRELLRTELINLRKLERAPQCKRLLLRLVRLYRQELNTDRIASLQQLIDLFPGTGTADENWMSLFVRAEHPPSESLQDQVQAQFDWLDVILEGCHKYHLRILYAFSLHQHNGNFPADVASMDYGALVAGMPKWARSRFGYLCGDPEHAIPVNQWRNIAAHKTFAICSSRTLDVTYGRGANRRTQRMTTASLRRVLNWSNSALNTLRLATVIVYLEYMNELHDAGLKESTLRLDSWLTGLFHNLRLVGFQGVSYNVTAKFLTIALFDTQNRPERDAIIHASQVLDQMSVAVDSDPAIRPRPEQACVRLLDHEGNVVAGASVSVSDAIAHSEGKSTLQQYVDSIDFMVKRDGGTQHEDALDGSATRRHK